MTSANIPFHIRARLLRSKCISEWHREDLQFRKRIEQESQRIKFASSLYQTTHWRLRIANCELKI